MKSFLVGLLLALFVFYAAVAHDVHLNQYETVSVNLGDTVVKVYHNKNIFPQHHKNGTLFFVHGNSASHKAWEEQLTSELFNRRYNLYAVDLPGHGASTYSTNPNFRYTAAGYADFVKGVVAALGLTDTVFVGWSLGGHILLEAYEREALFRQAAKGIVIHGTPPITTLNDILAGFLWTNPGKQYYAQEVVTQAEATVAVTSEFSLNVQNTGVPHQLNSVIAEWVQEFLLSDGRARVIVNTNAIGDEVTTVKTGLSTTNTPIAILHGREDQLVNGTYLEAMAPSIPTLWESKIHFVENTGHALFMQREDVYNDLLHRFMQKVFHHHNNQNNNNDDDDDDHHSHH
jgi:pimeloyl-ACP methyl ester carboxylesterase